MKFVKPMTSRQLNDASSHVFGPSEFSPPGGFRHLPARSPSLPTTPSTTISSDVLAIPGIDNSPRQQSTTGCALDKALCEKTKVHFIDISTLKRRIPAEIFAQHIHPSALEALSAQATTGVRHHDSVLSTIHISSDISIEGSEHRDPQIHYWTSELVQVHHYHNYFWLELWVWNDQELEALKANNAMPCLVGPFVDLVTINPKHDMLWLELLYLERFLLLAKPAIFRCESAQSSWITITVILGTPQQSTLEANQREILDNFNKHLKSPEDYLDLAKVKNISRTRMTLDNLVTRSLIGWVGEVIVSEMDVGERSIAVINVSGDLPFLLATTGTLQLDQIFAFHQKRDLSAFVSGYPIWRRERGMSRLVYC